MEINISNPSSAKDIYSKLDAEVKKSKDGMAITQDGKFLMVRQQKGGTVSKAIIDMARFRSLNVEDGQELYKRMADANSKNDFEDSKKALREILGEALIAPYKTMEYKVTSSSAKVQARENLENWLEAHTMLSQLSEKKLGEPENESLEKFSGQDQDWQRRYLSNSEIPNCVKKDLLIQLALSDREEILPVFEDFLEKFEEADEKFSQTKADIVEQIAINLLPENSNDRQKIKQMHTASAAIAMIVQSMSPEERKEILDNLEAKKKALEEKVNAPSENTDIEVMERNLISVKTAIATVLSVVTGKA
ncbi:MAG: hypothetical protein LBN94_01420 [Puniceicoccales bacterium]|jgi:hypothetical protein|nr:hypothetical protein [Puniceicoccales bacterium]